MSSSIQVFLGHPIDEPSEKHVLARLCRDLEERGISARVCANFVAGKNFRQIDLLIITSVRTVHCELKTYRAPVVGAANGAWKEILRDGSDRVLEGQNPYRQAHDGTYALSDDMRSLASRDPAFSNSEGRPFFKGIDTVICIYPTVPDGSSLEPYPYVDVVAYDELLERLARTGPFVPWSQEQWDAFIRDRSLFRPDDAAETASARGMARSLLDNYVRRFRDLHAGELHEYVAISARVDDAPRATMTPSSLSSEERTVSIVGPSGAGKTHLARHLALEVSRRGDVPLWLRAGEYRQGALSLLLARSVAPFTTATPLNLIRAAREEGRTVTIVVDGINECSPALRSRLLEQLSAFQLREPARMVLTTQESLSLPESLIGVEISLLLPDAGERRMILASHGGGAAASHADAFVTPFELAIAAECTAELSDDITRADLLDAYLRRRCTSATVRAGLRRISALMDADLRSAIPITTLLQLLERDSVPPAVVDDITANPMLLVHGGYATFSHEQFGRFLAAEALVLEASSGEALGRSLSEPHHTDLREYALALERDVGRLGDAIVALADASTTAKALRGELGELARRVSLSEVTGTLAAAARRIDPDHAELSLGQDEGLFSDRWETDHPLTRSERALLVAAGECGYLPELTCEIAALLDRTDQLCMSKLSALGDSGVTAPVTRLVGASYGLPRVEHDHCLPASLVVGACDRHRSIRWSPDSPPTSAVVHDLLDDAGPHSWGRLLVACNLYGPSAREACPRVAELLSKAWHAGGYHLRLAALQMAERNAASLTPTEHERVKTVLESLETRHLFLSSALVEALAAYGAVEPMRTLEDISAEIKAVLNDGSPEASRSARGIITSQFEEETIVGPYFQAVESLPADDRTRLLVMAAVGSEPGDWLNDWLVSELVEAGDLHAPDVQQAILRFASMLPKDAVSHQDVVSTYVAALRGCARFSARAPDLAGDDSDEDIQAWNCVGHLIFELARGDEGTRYERRARNCWALLIGELRAAAVDVLYELQSADGLRATDEASAHGLLLEHHPDEIRELLEWGLSNRDRLTSLFSHGFTSERDQYIVRTLGQVGNETTATLLRSYVHDETLGAAAVSSIRALRSRE